jgi:hypothetical protein
MRLSSSRPPVQLEECLDTPVRRMFSNRYDDCPHYNVLTLDNSFYSNGHDFFYEALTHGPTGGAYDTVPEVCILLGLFEHSSQFMPIIFDEAGEHI